MSTHYFMYTEVKVDGKWVCVNNKLKNADKGTERISDTYYSGSRSYFRETADKIEEIGRPIRHNELSAELQEIFSCTEDSLQYWRAFAVDPEKMYACFPRDSALKECCGYVQKNVLFAYQTGDIDDIYEYLSADEYLALPEEKRKCYSYYEWNSSFGWFKHFKEILEHFHWQRYEWSSVNYRSDKEAEFRLILIIS